MGFHQVLFDANPASQIRYSFSMFVLGIGYIEHPTSAVMVVLQPSVDWPEDNPMDLCVIAVHSGNLSDNHITISQWHQPMGKRWDENT